MSLSTKLVAGALALGLSACALGAAERVPSLADPSNPDAPESPVHGMAAILANDASAFSALEAPSGGAAPHAHESAAVYTCPMHPDVTSPEPGRCPKCGMNLVLREPAEKKPGEAAPSGGNEHSHGHEGHP